MRRTVLGAMLAASLVAGQVTSARDWGDLPAPRYAPEITEWRADDPAPRPGLTLEMLTALDVARATCTGNHGRMLARYKPRMLGWRRNWFLTEGGQLGFHYRRAYGERWEAVLAGQVAQIRARYEAHPDPRRFCRLAAIVARDGSGEHGGNDLRQLFATMIRYMDPAAGVTRDG